MTGWRKRQVMEMAREASDPDKVDPWRDGFWILTQEELERFAELVRADEREACAKVCEDSMEYAGDTLADAIRARSKNT